MRNPNRVRLWRATSAALIGALLAMFAMVAPASAAPTVDGNAKGSITVHKFEMPNKATGLPHNGTQVTVPTDLKPMAGVQFTINKVNQIDLSTNAGWAQANALSKIFNPANAVGSITGAPTNYTLGAPTAQTTVADGTTKFANLPVGLYLVTETGAPAGVTPAIPFLISIPLTDPNNSNNWLYDVHVYPKNSVTTATKTVDDATGIKLGDQVSFTINGDIPNDAIIDGYQVTDKLDPKLTYVKSVVTLADGTALVPADYTVSLDAATNTVKVRFSPEGLLKLAAHNTTQVKVVVTTTVNAVGEIANTALLYPNNASILGTPGTPGPVVTPPVETKWGDITFKKTNPAGDILPNAKFSVFASEADAKANTNPITLGGQTVFTVDPTTGEVTFSGLRYSGWANNAPVAPGAAGYNQYWLTEVQAPVGYELLAAPVPFTVTAGTTAVGVDMPIVNVPSNSGFELPLTGGPGTVLLYTAGGLLLVGAALLFVRSRRRTTG